MVGVTTGGSGWSVQDALKNDVEALLNLKELDTKDKFAVYGKCALFESKITCSTFHISLRSTRSSERVISH